MQKKRINFNGTIITLKELSDFLNLDNKQTLDYIMENNLKFIENENSAKTEQSETTGFTMETPEQKTYFNMQNALNDPLEGEMYIDTSRWTSAKTNYFLMLLRRSLNPNLYQHDKQLYAIIFDKFNISEQDIAIIKKAEKYTISEFSQPNKIVEHTSRFAIKNAFNIINKTASTITTIGRVAIEEANDAGNTFIRQNKAGFQETANRFAEQKQVGRGNMNNNPTSCCNF